MVRAIVSVGLVMSAGCATVHLGEFRAKSSFVPTPEGFSFQGPTGFLDIPDADEERMRLRLINDFVASHGVCPGGFDIIDRRVLRGAGGKVTYTGRCR